VDYLHIAECPACKKRIGSTVEVLPSILETGAILCPLCHTKLRFTWKQVTKVTGEYEIYDEPAPAAKQFDEATFLKDCGIAPLD